MSGEPTSRPPPDGEPPANPWAAVTEHGSCDAQSNWGAWPELGSLFRWAIHLIFAACAPYTDAVAGPTVLFSTVAANIQPGFTTDR